MHKPVRAVSWPTRRARSKAQPDTVASALSEDVLVAHFGQAQGHYLYRAARGIEDRPLAVQRERKSLSRETTFQHDVGDWHRIESALDQLTQELVKRLTEKGESTQSVTVKLCYADFETHTRTNGLTGPTDDLPGIRIAARDCLRRFGDGRKIRLVGVRLGSLRKGDTPQRHPPEADTLAGD